MVSEFEEWKSGPERLSAVRNPNRLIMHVKTPLLWSAVQKPELGSALASLLCRRHRGLTEPPEGLNGFPGAVSILILGLTD